MKFKCLKFSYCYFCTEFQLVLICSKEREDKSVVVTAFERYRVQTPVLQKDSDILRYVTEHLKSGAISEKLDGGR